MIKHGFTVTKHYILPTAWVATFTHGVGGRTLGVNSGIQFLGFPPNLLTPLAEMDALPAMGHACGHNLIAIAGVAVACAAKLALVKHNIPGTIILLGTPGKPPHMIKNGHSVLSQTYSGRRWRRETNFA